jgi:hypothetical protein
MRDALTSWPYKNLQVGKKGTLLTDTDGKANNNFKRKAPVIRKNTVCYVTSVRSIRFPVRRCAVAAAIRAPRKLQARIHLTVMAIFFEITGGLNR